MSFNITAQYFLDDVEVPNAAVTGKFTIRMKFIPFLNGKRMHHPRNSGTICFAKQISEPQLEDGVVRIYPFSGLELRITCENSEDAIKLYQQVVERYEKNTQAASPAPTISPQKSTEEAEQRKRKRHVDDVFEHMSSQGREELIKFSAPSAKRRDIDSMTTSVPERNSLGREVGRIMRREPQPPSSVLQRRPSNPPQDSSIYGGYRPALAFGLQNLGNTCYLNAVTQAVSSLREFVDDLRSMPNQLPEVNTGALFQRTVEILTKMQQSNALPAALSPAKLREQIAIAAPMFRGNGQQDAHEFFLEYMNQLHDELLRAHKAFEAKNGMKGEEHVLATQSHFDAEVERQLTCVQCGQARTVIERFRDFSLDFSGSAHVEQLPTMLRRYFQPELLEAKCEHCNAAEANLDTNLREAPRVLVLHLKRFVPDMEKQCYEKQHQAVDIPSLLDLGATLGNAGSASPPRLPARPLAPLAPAPAPESPETSPVKEANSALRYGLRAIVAHEGPSPRSGHYVCYAKSLSGTWCLYDDSRVTRLPQEPRDLGRKAYMLFYVLNGHQGAES